MNKSDMDNETSGRAASMSQGKTGGGSQVKGSASGSGGAPVQGTGIGEGNRPASSSQTRSAGAGTAKGQGDEGVLSQVQESGKDIASKGLQAIGDKTKSTTEGYKSEITSSLNTLADGLRQTSSNFRTGGEENALASAGARYIGDLAEKIESVSGYFERKDATELLRDVRGFARRNPTVFVGGAFAAGFALSRVIRTSFAVPTRNSGAGSGMRSGSPTGGARTSIRDGATDSPIRG